VKKKNLLVGLSRKYVSPIHGRETTINMESYLKQHRLFLWFLRKWKLKWDLRPAFSEKQKSCGGLKWAPFGDLRLPALLQRTNSIFLINDEKLTYFI
jgi:hypothetical protein